MTSGRKRQDSRKATAGRWTVSPGRKAPLALAGAGLALALALLTLATSASAAYSPELRRYPYLTDTAGTSATINWGSTRLYSTGVVRYGQVGTESCTAHTVTATKSAITVGTESQWQWKGRLTLSPDTEYCYRVYLGSVQIDLLGTDASPSFKSAIPAGSSEPYSFAVFGDWGKVASDGTNPHQANVLSQVASSGARFTVTTGDQAYPGGSQLNYGDLLQTGPDTSEIFGPSFWKVPGASIPIFPTMGNHGFSGGLTHLFSWPQDSVTASSGGRYTRETYCCLNETNSGFYPSMWYAFDVGNARFYALEAAWTSGNPGTSDQYGNDYAYHWTPTSDEYQWLQNDLATHSRPLKFAFFHYPLYSDNANEDSDTYLQGEQSLEGLLSRYGVDVAFNGHAHLYQRNLSSGPNGLVSYIAGGGGADLQPIANGSADCTPIDAYGIGWSYTQNAGSACGSAPVPTDISRVFHFLKVSVDGSGVTVTPTDELGRTFDVQTYPRSAANADLSLIKSDSPDPVLEDENVTYTMTVENNGPSDASGVVLTDKLPSGVTYQSASPSQGSCSETAGIVTCSLGSVANGGTATADITVKAQSAGTITNTATVVGDDLTDPNSSNDSASESTTVNADADLSLTKTDSPDPVVVSDTLTYTLSVHNNGSLDATNVSVTDNLPSGVTYQSATPSQGTCSEDAGAVTCSLGGLANGADATVDIAVTPQSAGTITNTASVQADEMDGNSENNSTSEDTTVTGLADLSITKTDSPDPVFAGQTLTYTLSVDNNGPSDAPSVDVTDNLPSGVTYESATPSQGDCSEASGTVSCSLGALANGGSATVEIQVTTQTSGTITNTASVTGNASVDRNGANDSSDADTTVSPAADLSVTKSDSADPVVVGDTLTYTLTARNNGPSAATGVTVTDTLPASVNFESATPSQGTCFTSVPGTVSCSMGGLANGGDATVEIAVTPQSAGTITNAASVQADEFDGNSANDSASEDTAVVELADLSITKTDSPDPVAVGGTLIYTLSVANSGPSDAPSVKVTDNLPSGVTYQSATSSQGSCSQASGVVSCDLGAVTNGGSATIDIQVTAQTAGTITNTASVTGDASVDRNGANDSSSANTTVTQPADLSITKTDTPDPVYVAQRLTYTLTARNNGPAAATGVTVTDALPASVILESATPSKGTCFQSPPGTVSCAIGGVNAGSTAKVTIKVIPQSTGTITNQGSVTGAEADPVAANNSASATTTVLPSADLSITKTDSPDPVVVNNNLTFTLTVTNIGPSPATGVVVTDTLVSEYAYQSSSASQGSCSVTDRTVTCNLGGLAVSDSASVTIVVKPVKDGKRNNTGRVKANEKDPVGGNNAATASTQVNKA